MTIIGSVSNKPNTSGFQSNFWKQDALRLFENGAGIRGVMRQVLYNLG